MLVSFFLPLISGLFWKSTFAPNAPTNFGGYDYSFLSPISWFPASSLQLIGFGFYTVFYFLLMARTWVGRSPFFEDGGLGNFPTIPGVFQATLLAPVSFLK